MFENDRQELDNAHSLMGLRKFGESIIVNIVIVSAIFAIVWYGLSQVTDPLMPV